MNIRTYVHTQIPRTNSKDVHTKQNSGRSQKPTKYTIKTCNFFRLMEILAAYFSDTYTTKPEKRTEENQ